MKSKRKNDIVRLNQKISKVKRSKNIQIQKTGIKKVRKKNPNKIKRMIQVKNR